MYDSSAGNNHECDNCGATLPAPDAAGTRTCTFCRSVYTAPLATAPVAPPGAYGTPQVSVVVTSHSGEIPGAAFQPVNAPSSKKGCGCLGSMIGLAVILALVGVPLYFGLRGSGVDIFDLKPTYSFGNQVLLLPGEPSAVRSFVTTSTRYESGKSIQQVLRFNGKDARPVWASPDVAESDANSSLVIDANNVYLVANTKLYAYKLADGSLVWQAALSDSLSWSSCQNCLQSIGSRVMVKTTDGVIQAFDAATGAPSWSRRLDSTSATLVRTAANLVVIDSGGAEQKIVSIDLSTGGDGPVIDPTCPRPHGSDPDHASWSDVYLPSPDGRSLLVLFGSSPACIQSFDPDTGTQEWGVIADGSSFNSSSVNVADSSAGLLIGDTNRLGVVDPAHAGYRDIATDPDSSYVPLGATTTAVVAEVRNTRGTPKTSIMGIDLAAGTTTWDVSFGKATSVDAEGASWSSSASYDGTFTAHLVGDTVRVFTMTGGSSYDHTISVDSINATSGAATPRVTVPSGSHDLIPSFGPPDWSGDKVVARIGDDTIQVIDTASATVAYKVP